MAASEFGKGIALSCGFDVGAKSLVDSRCIVQDLTELESMTDILRANGLLVYVIDEKRLYVWDEETSAWVAVGMAGDSVDVTMYVEGTLEQIEAMDIQLGTVVKVTGTPNTYYVNTTDGLVEIKNYDTLFEAITDDVKSIVDKTTTLETQTSNIQTEVEKITAILSNMNLVVPELYEFYVTRGTEKLTTVYVSTGSDISGGVSVAWSLRQSSVSLDSIIISTVNGDITVDPSFNSYTITGLPSSDQVISIVGTYTKDGLSYTTASLSVNINFMDIVYYGTAVEETVPTADFIKALSTTYSYSESVDETTSFTLRVDKGKYFYFCLPYALINSLYLTLNIGVVIANSGIVLVDAEGGVSYPYIGSVSDYNAVEVDGVEYAVIRTDRPGIGMLRFSFNIIS